MEGDGTSLGAQGFTILFTTASLIELSEVRHLPLAQLGLDPSILYECIRLL